MRYRPKIINSIYRGADLAPTADGSDNDVIHLRMSGPVSGGDYKTGWTIDTRPVGGSWATVDSGLYDITRHGTRPDILKVIMNSGEWEPRYEMRTSYSGSLRSLSGGRIIPHTNISGINNARMKSMHYDRTGLSDYILGAATGLGNTGTSFALMAWVNIDAWGTAATRVLFEKSTGSANIPFDFYIDQTSNKLTLRMVGPATKFLIGNTVIRTGYWYHVCAVRNGTDGKVYLYLNGAQDVTASSFTNGDYRAAASPAPNLGLGCTNTGGTTIDGLIGDARIFNAPPTDADVALFADPANIGLHPSGISGLSGAMTNASQIRFYNFGYVDNDVINAANAIKDKGSDAIDLTGYNFAGTSTSGVDWDVPAAVTPTVTSVSVDTTGLIWTLTFSCPIKQSGAGNPHDKFTLVGNGATRVPTSSVVQNGNEVKITCSDPYYVGHNNGAPTHAYTSTAGGAAIVSQVGGIEVVTYTATGATNNSLMLYLAHFTVPGAVDVALASYTADFSDNGNQLANESGTWLAKVADYLVKSANPGVLENCVMNVGESHLEIQYAHRLTSYGASFGFVFRHADASNYCRILFNPGSSSALTITIIKRLTGVDTTIFTDSNPTTKMSIGNTYTVKMIDKANNDVEIYINGILQDTYNFSDLATNTGCGVRHYLAGASTDYTDDLQVKAVA